MTEPPPTTSPAEAAAPDLWPPSRVLFALTAFSCLAGIALDLYWRTQNASIPFDGAGFTTTFEAGLPNVVNQLFSFVTLSNVMVGVASAALALRPGTESDLVQTVRISGLVNIVLTGLVFNFALADEPPVGEVAQTASLFQYLVNPALAIATFVAFGPFGTFARRRLWWAAAVLFGWIVISFVRGAALDWYPHDFMDVAKLGYWTVLRNLLVILLLWGVILGLAWGCDYVRRPLDLPPALAGADDGPRRPLVKIVYFDEQSASDYLDVSAGGSTVTEAKRIQDRSVDTHVRARAKLVAKFGSLLGLEGSSTVDASRLDQSVLSTTVSNTILTDYLAAAADDNRVVHLTNYRVRAKSGSMAHAKMYTPYMVVANMTEDGVDLSKLDEALESAKGYFELLAWRTTDKSDLVVLRFNLDAFRNNYGLTDMLRMRLAFYAIQVGQTTEDGLEFAAEIEEHTDDDELSLIELVDGPSATGQADALTVYDVVLAGVEHDDA